MIKNKKTPNYEEYEKSLTSSYGPPKYVAMPADGDKGFAMFQKAFKSQKKYYQPFIRSTNLNLEEH